MSVRGHWFIIAVLLFELVYRPYLYFGVDRYATYALPILALIGFNGYINYRLLSNRRITWHSILALYAFGHISNFRSDGVKHRLQPTPTCICSIFLRWPEWLCSSLPSGSTWCG